ncbi:MAG: hypothetical protein ACO3UZ_03135 [Burkholderiaceae bacterium]
MRRLALGLGLLLLQACTSLPPAQQAMTSTDDLPASVGRFVLFGPGLESPIQGRFEWWPAQDGAAARVARLSITDPWGQPQGMLRQTRQPNDWQGWSLAGPGGEAVSALRARQWARDALGLQEDQLQTLGALLDAVAQQLSPSAVATSRRIEASLPSSRGPLAIRIVPDGLQP